MLVSQSTIQKAVVTSQTNSNLSSLRSFYKPSLMAGVSYFLIFGFIASCSTFKIPGTKKETPMGPSHFTEMTKADYADHLASLKGPFLSTPGIQTVNNTFARNYLQNLAREIISKNEIFFKNLKDATVTIIDTDAPVHFSLPKGEVFLSDGLISKYIKHESMLVSILSYELVRSENLLYPRLTVIPVGHVPMERILTLGRLSLEEKVEVHKWAYYLTVRSGYDGEYYLSWLQTQNRNTADFILQVGDANLINREESLFKAFLIKNANEDQIPGKTNSSKNFYTFLNNIRDRRL
jgi:hypothetical protein